jgi:hypothetical protein
MINREIPYPSDKASKRVADALTLPNDPLHEFALAVHQTNNQHLLEQEDHITALAWNSEALVNDEPFGKYLHYAIVKMAEDHDVAADVSKFVKHHILNKVVYTWYDPHQFPNEDVRTFDIGMVSLR